MLDNKETSHTIVHPETNVYDVMIRLIEARQNLVHYTLGTTGEAKITATKEIGKLDEDFYQLRLIATDNYDAQKDS